MNMQNGDMKKTFYVDVDDTICARYGTDYSLATPYPKAIAFINRLYENGHIIVYYTARGSGSGKDWRQVTEQQFKDWGVLYHRLEFGKPLFDYIIDDKAINIRDLVGEE